MNLKILSWNVKGLNVVEKRLQIRNLLRTWRADIVCLQETKLEWITRGIVRSIWGCSYAMLHGHGHDTDTDTGIRQFLKNKDTTWRGHGG